MNVLDEASREVIDRLFNAAWREGYAAERRLRPAAGGAGGWAAVRLIDGRELVAAVSSVSAVDWIRTQPPYYVRVPAGEASEPVDSVEQVVQLWDAVPGFERFREEVLQSAENLGVFLDAVPARASALAPARGLLSFAHEGAAAAEGVPPEAWLEGWVLRGHPFHPGCKTRSGFDREDLRRYSPELGRSVALRFVAVRRDHLVERRLPGAGEDWPEAWTEALAAELRRRAGRRLCRAPGPPLAGRQRAAARVLRAARRRRGAPPRLHRRRPAADVAADAGGGG